MLEAGNPKRSDSFRLFRLFQGILSQSTQRNPRTGNKLGAFSVTPGSDKRLGLHVLCIKWDAAWQSGLKIGFQPCDSPYMLKTKSGKNGHVMYPHVTYHQYTMNFQHAGKSVTCPDFQWTLHKRSRTIRHRYAFDFSVWSGRHVDLEIRRNHSASVKPPISRGATLAQLFNKKYAKTCAKIMPKLGIKPMEKRRKTMEHKRKRMEKRRKKNMEKKKRPRWDFTPPHNKRPPHVEFHTKPRLQRSLRL